jgi:nucleotide-binding universal stress UspA family protein
MVKYISVIQPFREMEAVLLNIFNGVPESYWDMEMTQDYFDVEAWETNQTELIHQYMRKAKDCLVNAGYPDDNITIRIEKRRKGFARDIIKEAQSGYSAVMVGRRGMSSYEEIVLGSLAAKVLEKLSFIPILVSGSKPDIGKTLVALDKSENSERTVDFVCRFLCGLNTKVTLYHVVREQKDVPIRWQKKTPDKISPESVIREMKNVFEKSRAGLEASGFKSDEITEKIVTEAPSRAGAIVHEAKNEGYGTIVMGRRGLSNVHDFYLGRVSNKVIHMDRKSAVWVVS